MTSTAPQPTAASDWGAPRLEGTVLELPSGKFARLRRTLDLTLLLKSGQIPNPLANEVRQMIGQRRTEFDVDRLDEQMMSQLLDLIENTCIRAFVEPKLEQVPEGQDADTWKPDTPGAISIVDVDIRDRFFVWAYCQGGPTDLKRFREEPGEDVVGVRDGEAVQPAPEPAPVG